MNTIEKARPQRINSAHPMHIVALCDNSISMQGTPAKTATAGLRQWVTELQAAAQGTKSYFRFTMISFGSRAQIDVENVSVHDIDVEAIDLDGSGGSTNLAAALELAATVIGRDGGDEECWPPFVYLFTDGQPNDHAAAIAAAARLKGLARCPRVVSLGFGDADLAFLRAAATSPEYATTGADASILLSLLPEIGTPTAAVPDLPGFEQQISRLMRPTRAL